MKCRYAIARNIAVAGMLLGLAGYLVPLSAVAAEADQEPERCVPISRINSLEVLNRSQIAFEMVGGQRYVNELPHPCPSLRKHATIMYRTSIDSLCDVDIITVLDSVGGGLLPSGSCGLGKFHPISKQELDDLKSQSDS